MSLIGPTTLTSHLRPSILRKHQFHLAFGTGCGLGMAGLTWLLGSDSLATSSLTVSSALSSFFGFINIIPYFLSAILSGGDFGEARGEFAYWALVFVQWAAVGIAISVLVCQLCRARRAGP